MKINRFSVAFLLAALLFVWFPAAARGGAIDWSRIRGEDIMLFHPGQISWEWIMTDGDHPCAPFFRAGTKACADCHTGMENEFGSHLVTARDFEPTPIPGKPPYVVVNVKFAHDGESLYTRFKFDPGRQPDARMDRQYETKIALMFDDGRVPEATRAGCWGACHEDSTSMPAANGEQTTLYLSRSRQRMSRQGGLGIRSRPELEQLRDAGYFMEYWQAKLNRGDRAVAVDGIVLDRREVMSQPVVAAVGTHRDGVWTVTLSRRLNQGAPYTRIRPGRTYTFGIALHAGHTADRFHYVSFEKTFALNSGRADFIAVRH